MSEQDAVAIAEMRGEMRAMRELFSLHNQQDASQFSSLTHVVSDMDNKLDELLLREAHRDGEFDGVKRTAMVLSGTISILIAIAGVAVALNV
jgi:hypothetical protein